jgi:hypothetical protein
MHIWHYDASPFDHNVSYPSYKLQGICEWNNNDFSWVILFSAYLWESWATGRLEVGWFSSLESRFCAVGFRASLLCHLFGAFYKEALIMGFS